MKATRSLYFAAAGLVLVCGLLFSIALFGPGVYRLVGQADVRQPDLEATLQVLIAHSTASAAPATTEPAGTTSEPAGRIAFTCQVEKFQSSEQICIMNADGSGARQLTEDLSVRHFYPSIGPRGVGVVYSQYREENVYEIYELDLAHGGPRRLTEKLGVLTAPEISPDGSWIAFMRWTPASDRYEIWMMDRDGENPHRVFDGVGWDPTWAPDGSELLFASDMDGSVQLYRVGLDGADVQRISSLPAMRGRSDWSSSDQITTYSGEAWSREIFIMNKDGSEVRQVSPPGGNSQGPSFSPDGQWIAFTAYFDHFDDIHGCEIYIVRIDGTDLRRLTDNDYCDYQPRWGP